MNGFMAMAEFLRNSAPAMKGRALTGPHDYEQISELADRGRLRVQRFLEEIDQIISTKSYVAGDQFSIADIDLLVFIEFAAWRKLGLPEGAANARRWYEDVRVRPSAQL
jgi:glutathione S-transferase